MTADHRRIGDLIEASVRRDTEGRDVAVAFSGGLDSGLIAVLAGKHARSTVLYTAGSEGSYDVRMAEEMSRRLDMDWVHLRIDLDGLESSFPEMMAITGTTDPVTLSFEIPMFFVCRSCRESTVLSGQGADEMFIGYSKYVGLDDGRLSVLRGSDIDRLNTVTLAHESSVAETFGKTMAYPFLDACVVDEVMRTGIEDLRPVGDSRKDVLRDIARDMGYPFIADKKKKAAQYGSGTMDMIRDICRTKNMTYAEWVGGISAGMPNVRSDRGLDG